MANRMETKIILQEKDIKRAIADYLLSQKQGKVLAIRLEKGDRNIADDPREFSRIYAEVELEVEAETTDTTSP